MDQVATSCLVLSLRSIRQACQIVTAIDSEEPVTFAGLAGQIRDTGSAMFRTAAATETLDRPTSWRVRGFEDFGSFLIRELPTLEEGRYEDLREWNPARAASLEDTFSFTAGVVMFAASVIGTQAALHGVDTADLLAELRQEALAKLASEDSQ